MARKYNPSTDFSSEVKKENGLTPKQDAERKIAKQKELDWRQSLEQESRKNFEKATEEKMKAKYSKVIVRVPVKKRKLTPVGVFLKTLPRLKPRGSQLRNVDRLKLMKMRNQLEKQRLLNQIEKLKIMRKLQGAKQIIPIAPMKLAPKPFFNPITTADINSMYADIGHADGNIWGDEEYFTENYYDEDYLGNENFFEGLEINNLGKRVASPLLY